MRGKYITEKIQKSNVYKLSWIGIGKADFLYKQVRDYRTRLDSPGLVYVYGGSEGGHSGYTSVNLLQNYSDKRQS